MRKMHKVAWGTLIDHAQGPPFSFINGFKHVAKLGVCCRFHSHPIVEIVYHRSGEGITRLSNGDVIAFTEGNYILYPPEMKHDQVMEVSGEDLCLQIAVPQGSVGINDGCLKINSAHHWVREDIDRLTSTLVPKEPIARQIIDLQATSILLELLYLHQKNHEEVFDRTERSVTQAENFIRKHFAQLSSLNVVAEHVGLSHDHLRHLYKQRRGISLVQFLIQTRMERAKSLLSTSNMSLKQIAPLCGYHDEYYFSAAFRRAVGKNPSTYRSDQRTIIS